MIVKPYTEADLAREALQHQRSVYVDVDDTLLLHRDFTVPPQLNLPLLEQLGRLRNQGVQLVLWSGNAVGLAGARSRASQLAALGLDVYALFDAVLAKPHVILDDKADWFANTHLLDVSKP